MTSFNNMIKVALTNFALSEGNSFKPTTTIKMRINFKLFVKHSKSTTNIETKE